MLKPDLIQEEIDFWHCEIVTDPVSIILPKENPSPCPIRNI